MMGNIAATKAPLRERLAVFWHDHFAVSDAKVEDGVMMLEYIKALRENPAGKFQDTLKRMVTTAAFLKYLDVRMMTKATPNENFAREVMELYTLGIGNYTEADIKEAARALTGWSWLNVFYEIPGTQTDRMNLMAEKGQSFIAFAFMPKLHDRGEKTILGKKLQVDGDGLLEFLSDQPATARHLCRKLWEHFVYEGPEQKVIDRLAAVWRKSDGSVREVLRVMTQQDEFWSEKAQTTRVKSPFDLVMGITRALGVQDYLREEMRPDRPYTERIAQKVFDDVGAMTYFMDRMGFSMLYPEDVDGWKWGEGWLSPSVMHARTQFRGVRGFKEVKKDEYAPDVGMIPLITYLKGFKDAEVKDFSEAFLAFFDARLSPESRKTMEQFWTAKNYKALFQNDSWVGWTSTEAMGLMASTPGYQIS
jgi:uncharacterized protein (DUF1800 family)